MASREEQKEQREKISQSLIEAALQLCEEEGYSSLSLRSIARKAGIAPTSFYRNFRDIDELGLAIIDQGKNILYNCMDKIKKEMDIPAFQNNLLITGFIKSSEGMVRTFVETLMDAFKKNTHIFYVFLQERTGSSKVLRASISKAIEKVTNELTDDLEHLSLTTNFLPGEIRFFAEVMITIAFDSGLKNIVQKVQDWHNETELVIKKINMLITGALVLKDFNQGEKK